MISRLTLLRTARRAVALAAVTVPIVIAGCGHTGSLLAPAPLPPLSAVVIYGPDHDTLAIGGKLILQAVGVDSASGDTLAGLNLDWASTDASVATVANGRVSGVSEGSARIIASGSGKADTVQVFVRPAGSGWLIVPNTLTTTNLRGVFFLSSGRTGWAVGDGGTILKSSDAGGTWSRQNPTAFNLHAVHFSGTIGMAVGANGTVLYSSDLGTTWTALVVPQAASNVLNDVILLDATHAFAVGGGGTLIRTTDGGAHWTRITTSTAVSLNGIAFSGADGWVVGDQGAIFGTHDGGASWYRVTPAEVPTTNRLLGVARRSQPVTLDASGAVAVGAAGVVLRAATTADSIAWSLANAGASYQLNAVTLPIGQLLFAAGQAGSGAILRSDDGGVTWTPQQAFASGSVNDIIFVDAYRGWAVGEGGLIRHTATGGVP